jgi:peptidoglycan/LPS O-acetylase OafA/YrhL
VAHHVAVNSGTPTTPQWRLDRRPALDGLRGVAILLVVASHTLIGTGIFQLGGAVGVDLFFALSGYLITGLLIPGVRLGRFDIRGFYARRARRLLPAAYLTIAGTWLLLWMAADPWVKGYTREAAVTVAYVRNVYKFPRDGFDGALGHMWSLAVEEQFYIVWPVLLLLIFSASKRLRVSPLLPVAALTTCAFAWRIWLTIRPDPDVYHRLDVSAALLLTGAFVAVAESNGHTLTSSRAARVGLVVLLVSAAAPFQANFAPSMWVGVVTAGGAVLVLTRGSDAVLSHPVLRGAGRVSYGWYLWHVPLMSVWIGGHEPGLAQRVAGAALGLCLALASWHCVERPILARRRSVKVVDGLHVEAGVSAVDDDRAAGECSQSERHVPA